MLGGEWTDMPASGAPRVSAWAGLLLTAQLAAGRQSRAPFTLTHDEQPRTAPDSLDLPSFMLIGFMKAGTTYLRGLLDSHPELSTKSDMGGYSTETHFFDSQFTDETAESADLDQVRRAYAESFQGAGAPEHTHFPARELHFLFSFACPTSAPSAAVAGAQHKYKLFDDTPKYSRMDLERIRLLNATVSPETKFVVSLRDPIELTMSRVRMGSCEVARGSSSDDCSSKYLKCSSSTDCTLNIPLGWSDEYGDYTGRLSQWISVVGRARMHVVIFDDLVERTLDTLNGVLRFVGTTPMEQLPTGVSSTPLKEENCGPCKKIEEGAIAKYIDDPSTCEPLANEGRADLDELNRVLRIETPTNWADSTSSCRGGEGFVKRLFAAEETITQSAERLHLSIPRSMPSSTS